MTPFRFFLFLLFFLLRVSPLFPMGASFPPESHFLRVAVVNGEKEIAMEVKGPYEIVTLHTGELLKKGKILKARFTPGQEGLRIGDEPLWVYGVRVVPGQDATLFLDGKPFRGIVDLVRRKDMTLLAVNHVALEKYLYGVLPYEIPHHWPEAMLELQTILARSYALFKKMEHEKEEYDVVATVLSQRYGGSEEERWRIRRAVDRTAGKVLTYNGTLFPTFYHSTCGGHTEDAETAGLWKKKLPPLQGVFCTYCEHSPFYHWERSFSLEDIAYRLRKSGESIPAGLRDLRVEGKTLSGRARTIVMEWEKGRRAIPASDFRLATSPTDLRSTRFDLEVKGERVFFRGQGWGHGVGLCQWGALGMVERGFSVEAILSFYYPGSEIRELPNIPWER